MSWLEFSPGIVGVSLKEKPWANYGDELTFPWTLCSYSSALFPFEASQVASFPLNYSPALPAVGIISYRGITTVYKEKAVLMKSLIASTWTSLL